MGNSHNQINSNGAGNNSGINYSKPIIIGIVLNTVFIVIEVIYGFLSDSMALLTDAGHNFSDVLSLLLAGLAAWMIKKQSTKNYTYGFKKGSVLIAFINSALLLLALGAISWEAVQRLHTIHVVNGKDVIIVAAIGIVINGITALMFFRGKDKDLNIKSVFFHMLTDTLVSFSVVISGILIMVFNFNLIDPIISLVIVLVILYSATGILRETFRLSMDAVPYGINFESVSKYLSGLNGVREIHDLHIWGMSTAHTALTVHLVMPDGNNEQKFLEGIRADLHNKFGIEHTTIQIDNITEGSDCEQADCN